MDNPNVPVENAYEPAEEARQPSNNSPRGPSKLRITFADDTDTSEKCSQKSIGYKEALSQPPASFGHKQRLEWLQHRRSAGLYVQCDSCDSWRYLPQVLDKYDLPEKWYCSMNPDKAFANCFIPEVPLHIRDEEDLIHAEYSAGSVVWARMAGWPWWPAMVDDCPDAEEYYWLDGFSDIPTHYNVVFFDTLDVTRAWISPDNLKPFGTNKNLLRHGKEKKYKKRLEDALKQANDANNLPLQSRLAKYSFISRYAGKISTPRKINQHEIRKFKAAMKRKFNVDFPVESSSDSDADVAPTETINKKHIKKSKTTKHNKKDNDQRKSSTKKNNKTKSNKNKNVEINGNNEKESNDDNEREISANNETEISANDETEISANNETKITANTESEINGKNDKECELANKDDDLTNVIDTTQDIPLSTQTSDVPEIIQDSLMANNTQETEDVSNSFVKPNSLVVQLGSTANDDTCAIDNDSSTTYAPESQTDNNTMSEIMNDLEDRASSPGSDNFDF